MSDVSTLKQNPQPLPPNSYRSRVSGRLDADISVDVGMPVTPDPTPEEPGGAIFFANAESTEALATVIGLAASATEAGKAITIQYAGPLSLPTERWDRVTGQTGGLTPNAVYYLDGLGLLTTLVASPSDWTTRIGVALTSTTLMIAIEPPVAFSP